MLKNMENSTKLALIGIIFLFMILYILFTSIGDSKRRDYTFIGDYLNSLNNNYSLDINIGIKSIKYSRDENIEVFESKSFDNNKYIKYDGKLYVYDKEKLKEIENNNDLIDKHYYDINLISKVIDKCTFKRTYDDNLFCIIDNDSYNKELSTLYGIGRTNDKNVVIDFYIKDKVVDKLNINYGDEKVDITIDKNANNNYNELLEMIK